MFNSYLFLTTYNRSFMNTDKFGIPTVHCKKRLAVFPSPDEMSLTKLPLAGNNFILPGQGEFGK
jgi:hypothetical protein